MSRFTESQVEEAMLALFEPRSYGVESGLEIAPGEPADERNDYGQVVLAKRFRDTLRPKLISGELRVKEVRHIVAPGGV